MIPFDWLIRPTAEISDTGSSRLKGYCEGRFIADCKSLTIHPVNDRARQKGARKNPPEEASGGLLQSPDRWASYAFMAPFTASAVIGSERTRAPEALKIPLPSTGAITVTAGSPTPVAFSPLAMTLTATSGI